MEPESNAPATDRDRSSNHRDGGLLAHVEARLRSVVTRPSIQAELAWRRILRTAVLIRRPLQSRNVILFLIAAAVAGSVVALLQSSTGLPVSTPPNAIAYASGELAARDFSLAGTLLGVLAAALIGALGGPIIGFWMAT